MTETPRRPSPSRSCRSALPRRTGTGWCAWTRRGRASRRSNPVVEVRPSWLRRLAFVFALLAQVTGLALAVAEGREGVGAGTHIEAVGAKAHYAHDETTCGACHLRSMHGGVVAPPRLAVVHDFRAREPRAAESRPPVADRTSSNPSRAPPTVI